MDRRLSLHDVLIEKFHEWMNDGKDYTDRVKFQPTNSTRLVYPCITYNRGSRSVRYADNKVYHNMDRYTVVCIDRDPDSKLREYIGSIPYSSEEPTYKADNLYHFPFTIYY